MPIQLICQNGVVEFPQEFHQYSDLIQKMATQKEDYSESESESDGEEEELTETIIVKSTIESTNLMFALLRMAYNKNTNNIHPPNPPKKVTAPKFNIEETIGKEAVNFFTEAGKDGVFAITKVADFLDIKLATHMCFTWIAHNLNTLSTEEKMGWLGLKDKAPTFEEVMKVDLKTGHIPDMATKLPPAHIEEEGGATK